jgi:cysteine desulfuration protein SufE
MTKAFWKIVPERFFCLKVSNSFAESLEMLTFAVKNLGDMTINEIQDEIIEEFSGFDDWMDKYQLLIDLGNEQAPLDDKYKTEQNLIDGCQSRVWLQADYADGVIRFTAESDALIVKGIVALLIRVLSGHTPQEILDADLYFIEEIGLKEHLSPTRSNGLLAMVKQMRMYALAFKAKE